MWSAVFNKRALRPRSYQFSLARYCEPRGESHRPGSYNIHATGIIVEIAVVNRLFNINDNTSSMVDPCLLCLQIDTRAASEAGTVECVNCGWF